MKKQMVSLIFCGNLMTFLTGCGRIAASESHTNVIIGDSDMASVSENDPRLPKALLEQLDAIGLTNNKCTAFHLGGGIVATAGHCLPKPVGDVTTTPCQNFAITWGVTHNRTSLPQVSRCLRFLDYALDNDRDFALLKVDPAPAAIIRMQEVETFGEGARLLVLGHPEGKPMHLSTGCNLAPASFSGRGDGEFSHQCDTLPGHSGSPVFDTRTMSAIGIHNGGEGTWNYGTLLDRTSIGHHLASVTHRDQTEADPSKAVIDFGPFSNNQNMLLTSLPSRHGDLVSFAIQFNMDEFDTVQVTDGRGQSRRMTGMGERVFHDLKTPVTVSFQSDYAVASQAVEIRDITYDGAH